MTKRLFAPLLLSVLLAACGADAPPASEAPAAAPVAATTAATAPVAGEPAIEGAPAVDPAAAPAEAEAAIDGEPHPAPAAPETATGAPPAAQGPALVAGTDYVEIPGGQPFAPLEGKVEVVEVFAYSCGACAAFDPLVASWKARLPSDVRFTLLPAVFYEQDNYPKAFFAADANGVADRLHAQMFQALHVERALRPNASAEDIIKYMAKHGADAAQLRGTIDSFAVKAQIARTKQFIIRSGIDSTPTVVVNGKYRVRGRSFEDILRITDQLVARERAAAQAGGTH